MECFRVGRNTLSTPFLTYRREDQTICLMGMIHLGTQRYYEYQERQLYTHARKGYLVFYENMSPCFSHSNKELLVLGKKLICLNRKLLRSWATILGGVFQRDQMKYDHSWVCSDIPAHVLFDDWYPTREHLRHAMDDMKAKSATIIHFPSCSNSRRVNR